MKNLDLRIFKGRRFSVGLMSDKLTLDSSVHPEAKQMAGFSAGPAQGSWPRGSIYSPHSQQSKPSRDGLTEQHHKQC